MAHKNIFSIESPIQNGKTSAYWNLLSYLTIKGQATLKEILRDLDVDHSTIKALSAKCMIVSYDGAWELTWQGIDYINHYIDDVANLVGRANAPYTFTLGKPVDSNGRITK